MKKGYLLIIALVILAAITAAGFLWYRYRQNQSRKYLWNPTYQSKGILKKQPYNLWVARQLLKDRQGDGHFVEIRKPLRKFFSEDSHQHGTYIFMGWVPYYSAEGVETLISFASKGNHIFLAANRIPEALAAGLGLDSLVLMQSFMADSSGMIETTIIRPPPQETWRFTIEKGIGKWPVEWFCLDEIYCKTGTYEFSGVGYLGDGSCTMGTWKIGTGTLTIHTNPILFTNYYLIKPDGFDHACKAFSFLERDADVYFDVFSLKTPKSTVNTTPGQMDESLLGFILSSGGLKEAWYLLMLMAVLYLIFTARRVQRPVPVIEPATDDTLEYVRTLGRLYQRSRNHLSMALKQRTLFYRHLSRKYNVRTDEPSGEQILLLAAKTGLTAPFLKRLLTDLKRLDNRDDYSEADLLELHNRLHYFYSQTV
ncbi:MAG TPA: hypothetical protein P5228_03630 [Bacteroidales bacterium]|nr:hypothetical protein [Bacteroidales bacterium]HRZ48761.1 hypothetical protein [Bacteroidales bacterium]